MDAHLDTLTTKMYQVNTHVSRIARCQARLGGFVESALEAFEVDEAFDDNDDFDDDDDDEDRDASSSSADKMST